MAGVGFNVNVNFNFCTIVSFICTGRIMDRRERGGESEAGETERDRERQRERERERGRGRERGGKMEINR